MRNNDFGVGFAESRKITMEEVGLAAREVACAIEWIDLLL
jgi:hypothetical protein